MVAYALVDTHSSYLALAEESSLDWRAYHSRVRALSRSRGAPDAEEARLMREGLRIEIWRKVGERSMLTYVERYFGYGRRCAYDRLRVAVALGELPLVEKALTSGELFYATVRELTRVAIWETEEAWLEKAMGKSVHEVRQDGGGAVIELPKETVERIECDAERMDAQGKVSRHIPETMRRRVLVRDHHRCRVPWCHSAHNLEPHHIEHFAHGGKTVDDNLITLCWHHHTAIHERKLRLTMEKGEVKFERIEPAPLPANETHPPSMTETAIRALVGMGFKKSEAQSFVATASAHVGKAATLSDLVHEALKRSPKPQGSF